MRKYVTVTVVVLAAGIVLAMLGTASADRQREFDFCPVRVSPEKVVNLGDLRRIEHDEDSSIVRFYFDSVNEVVINQRYEDPATAQKWIGRTMKQARRCLCS